MSWSRKLKATLSLMGVLGAALLASGSAAASTPTPAWNAVVTPYPTNFVAGTSAGVGGSVLLGPGLYVLASNVGGAPTSGTYSISVTLPAGLAPAAALAEGKDHQEGKLSCTTNGQTVTCTGSGAVSPGEWVEAKFPVSVEPGAKGTLRVGTSVSGGGASAASALASVPVVASSLAFPSFAFLDGRSGLSSITTNADGVAATQAGSHPYQLTTSVGFPGVPVPSSVVNIAAIDGGVKDVIVNLPPGVTVNPTATPALCTEAQLASGGLGGEGCPAASQVGVATLNIDLHGYAANTSAIYNMVPPSSAPAELGFTVTAVPGLTVRLVGGVRSVEGDYGLSATSRNTLSKPLTPVLGAQITLWGNPTDESHDAQRGECANLAHQSFCPTPERLNRAFLTMPTACSGPLTTTATADSWDHPGGLVSASSLGEDASGNPVDVRGCSILRFEPTITLTPESRVADSPTGLEVDLHVPQSGNFEGLASANLKDARVTLPAGIAVNPAAANGLGACAASEINLSSPEPADCPNAAKIGTVEVDTPLLDHPLPGAIYMAKPHENPFDSLLAIYIAVHDPESGVVIKLAGHVEADATTGQLTTTFDENPELPFEDFKLDFFGGTRAALKTPATCGTYTSRSELIPWSGGATVGGSDAFVVDQAAGGAAVCPSGQAGQPNTPSFEAGTTFTNAGLYSPFVLKLSREDGSQRLTGLDLNLPPGLTGKLAGIPYCSETQIAQARSRDKPGDGALEQASPSCPAASQVGTVNVGAGAGSQPYYVQGKAYLAGSYKGAPLSMVIVTPAVAGPFDLGVVTVRTALYVDQRTARISAKSDPLPTILEGIPLDIRSIAVQLDRPGGFTLNPTNCEAMSITGQATSTTGNVAQLNNRFQVGGCAGLPFKPHLKLRLKGATKRTGHPALKAVVTYPKHGIYANIARAQVGLPHSEFLDQGNLDKVCKQANLHAGTCPKRSIYGWAKAWTPLLDKPLQGPVYLGVGFGYKLPALVADLNGQIRILLVGRVDTTRHKGIRNTFEVVPDAPVSRFELRMKGGKKYGLLTNSENICRKKQRASALFVGQNGARLHMRPKIRNSCKHKRRKAHRSHARASGKRHAAHRSQRRK